MKKFISLFLTLFILLSLFIPANAAYVTGEYIVSDEYADIYFSPVSTARKIGEVSKNTVVEVTEIRNDTYGRITLQPDGITGWIKLSALKFRENGKPTDITGIKIKTLPKKLTYIDGIEKLDLSGLSVVSTDKNNNEAYITGYSVFSPEMKVPGEKTVTVSYSPDGKSVFTAEFSVTVIREDAVCISAASFPKTQYLENQLLDLSGLSVLTEFSDTSKNETLSFEEIINDSDYIITGCHGEEHGSVLSAGRHTIKISYKYEDISCIFDIDVTPRSLISLKIKKLPDNLTVYSNKEIPALDGLILEAEYDNGEKEDIYHYSCEAVCDPSSFIIGPGNTVTVKFGGKSVEVDFRYSAAVPQKIVLEFKDKDGNTIPVNFIKGEEIDLSGIRVRLVYTDDTFRYIDDFIMSSPDYTVMGSQNISVEYLEFSEVFTIYISEYNSKGDVAPNGGDGKITAVDARTVLRASVGLTTLGGKLLFAGDADRNGKITANDARLILRASVGLENLYITL
ncbi:MAG: hypothetical protein E7535_02550 [Ruminococcaceae bacterium]|nr:hypothetical protein [Oscillospiraceae bacterium]